MPEYTHKTGQTAGRVDSATIRSASHLTPASLSGSHADAVPQHPLQATMNSRPVVQAVSQLKQALNQSARVAEVAQLSSMLHDSPPQAVHGGFETVQRAAIEDDEEMVAQGKFATAQREAIEDEENVMQSKAATAQRAVEPGHDTPNQTGMPGPLKAAVESMSGMDLSDVRVHANSEMPASLGALAYAQGNDIHLASGQEHHLPHEAWHVVQQRQGRVAPTLQMQGVNINDDGGLEAEADRMGAQASQLKRDTEPSAR
jgi:hypothetical protein